MFKLQMNVPAKPRMRLKRTVQFQLNNLDPKVNQCTNQNKVKDSLATTCQASSVRSASDVPRSNLSGAILTQFTLEIVHIKSIIKSLSDLLYKFGAR